jgi:hypothetical protein
MKANRIELNTLRIYILKQGYKNINPIKKKERPVFWFRVLMVALLVGKIK